MVAAATIVTTTLGASASASGAAPALQTVASGLAGPLGLAVGADGTVYVSESNAGTVDSIDTHGNKHVIAGSANNLGTAGVDVSRSGTVAYTLTSGEGAPAPVGLLNSVRPNGVVSTLGDLAALEKHRNPDHRHSYGFLNLSAACAAQIPPEIGGSPYHGDVNSNPYAVASMADGSWVVADAGGNDLVRVRSHGHLSVVAVLPPNKTVITSAIAGAVGLPSCTVGKTYAFEPVPTDVEVGPHGLLYVTSLPGGPEDASLGARGAVYAVNPRTGHSWLVARGFLGATDLAVSASGTIYVTELFGNRVAQIKHGRITLVRTLEQPSAIEWHKGKLYVTTGTFGPDGSVVSFWP